MNRFKTQNEYTKVLQIVPHTLFQAFDNDQENTGSSSLTYYIKSCTPVPCSNFSLDEQSGQLNVVSVLDYEQMQHELGKIEIIVEARDKGSTPRSGNTTVVINVEVRINKSALVKKKYI